jgi:hypothetical protein
MISWDHHNLFNISFSAYKRRVVLIGKVSLIEFLKLAWSLMSFDRIPIYVVKIDC